MKRTTVSLLILIALIVTGVVMFYFKQNKKQPEPKKLVAKFSFGKQGKELGEFYHPFDITVKGDHLYVSDTHNFSIQVLEIKY